MAEDTWGLIKMQPGWDDCSPWSPWTSLTPPFARLSLAPCWCAIPASTLLNVTNISHPNTGTACGGLAFNTALRWGLRAAPASATRSRGGLFPPPAGEADSDAEDWHGEAGENFGENEDEDLDDLSGALDSFSAGGGGGGGGSLAALVGRLAANALRPACAADSLAQLCSGEVWETPSWRAKHGASSLCPEAPRESVLQDRLRDVFDAPALPMALGGASPLSRHGLGRAPPTTPSRAAAAGGTPQKKVDTSAAAAASVSHAAAFELPRSCPPHSLLAQLALHCLSCGDARSVAQLWERFVRELRFSHWETGTPLPRMSDLCGGAGAVPDLGASLLHQKLQLLQICIARRAEEAGLAARDAAEALERPRGGEEAAAAAARGRGRRPVGQRGSARRRALRQPRRRRRRGGMTDGEAMRAKEPL